MLIRADCVSIDPVSNYSRIIVSLISTLTFLYIDTAIFHRQTNQNLNTHYGNHGTRINDVFKLSASDAYAFILDNRSPSIGDSETKKVDVTLVHTWQQEIRESQLKDREVNDFNR